MSSILLIRMLEVGDVASIALPAARYLEKHHPDSQLQVLTHGEGLALFQLAMPNVPVLHLENHFWPDNILQAMEAFLGLAEQIIGQDFKQIVNLDTAFMPCFLARFLKDAGEPVTGNMLSISVAELIDQIQNQSLQADYVNDYRQYMQSSYFGMYKWQTPWWESGNLPDHGYSEFYLRQCCGFNDIEMDISIAIAADKALLKQKINQSIICLALGSVEQGYPYLVALRQGLRKAGYVVTDADDSVSVEQRLARLKASELLVCLPNAAFALANAVGTPTLLLSTDVDPRILMPDYATEQSEGVPSAQSLVESIQSIFSEAADERN